MNWTGLGGVRAQRYDDQLVAYDDDNEPGPFVFTPHFVNHSEPGPYQCYKIRLL